MGSEATKRPSTKELKHEWACLPEIDDTPDDFPIHVPLFTLHSGPTHERGYTINLEHLPKCKRARLDYDSNSKIMTIKFMFQTAKLDYILSGDSYPCPFEELLSYNKIVNDNVIGIDDAVIQKSKNEKI